MKLCKDCRHSVLRKGSYYCAAIGVSKVNGIPDKMCETERNTDNKCGSEGRLFESEGHLSLGVAIIAPLISLMLLLMLLTGNLP